MSGELPIAMPTTMSSREIAELTEKEHKHVIRDVKVMLTGLYGLPDSAFDASERDGPDLDHLAKSVTWERDTRKYVACFHLDKQHTMTLVAGYDVRLRTRIIDRLEKRTPAARHAGLPLAISSEA